METLKRILTVMIIVLTIIVVGGGIYLAAMGNMNHGTTAAVGTDEKQDQSTDLTKNEEKNSKITEGSGVDEEKKNQSSEDKEEQVNPQDSSKGDTVVEGTANGPVIIQVPAPVQQVDPSIYVNQLKEKLKSINESNSSIASNSGGHGVVVQSNGSAASTDGGNMNQLHQNFYKLGQDVAAMENTLEDLSRDLQRNQIQNPQPGYYQYQAPNYVPTNPYPVNPSQDPSSQTGGAQAPNSNQAQPGQSTDQASQSTTDQGHGSAQAATHNAGLNLLNVDTLKVVLSLALVVSILFGIISVIGFLVSLLKGNPVQRQVNEG